VQVGVVHLDTGRRRDVGSGDRAGALLAQVHHDRLVVLRGDDQALDVEDDLGDVLLDPADRGELVQHTVDADAGHRGTRDAREQGATKRVAERVAEAGLEGLDDEAAAVVRNDLFAEGGALCDEHAVLPFRRRPLYDADEVRRVSPGRSAHLCPWTGQARSVCRARTWRTRHTELGQFFE